MTTSRDGAAQVRIGVTGHRFLAEIDKLTAAIELALDKVTDAL